MNESVRMCRHRRDGTASIETFPVEELQQRIEQQFNRREFSTAMIGDVEVGRVWKDDDTCRWSWWYERRGRSGISGEDRDWMLDSIAGAWATRKGL